MKNFTRALSLSLFVPLSLISNLAWGQGNQSSGTSQIEKPKVRQENPAFIAKGVKVGLTAANFDLKAKRKFEYGGYSESTEGTSDKRYGFGGLMVGFEYLRRNKIGFNADMTVLKHSSKEDGEAAIAVATFNGNYGFNVPASLYAGLNISRWTQGVVLQDSSGNDVYPIGVGGQFGGAYNFTRNIQLSLGYLYLSQKAEYRYDNQKVGELEIIETSVVSALSFIF